MIKVGKELRLTKIIKESIKVNLLIFYCFIMLPLNHGCQSVVPPALQTLFNAWLKQFLSSHSIPWKSKEKKNAYKLSPNLKNLKQSLILMLTYWLP